MQFLIVDDHSAVREGLGHVLATEFPESQVSFAATADEAMEQIRLHNWTLVIIDITLRGRDGLELTREIKRVAPKTCVLIHTMHHEDQFGVRSVRAGADGYLTKDQPVTELFNAMHQMLEGRRYVSAALADQLVEITLHPPQEGKELLSKRESEIMHMLSAGRTSTEIGNDLGLSVKTVSTYRARILEKLKLRTTADIIRYGIVHESGDEYLTKV